MVDVVGCDEDQRAMCSGPGPDESATGVMQCELCGSTQVTPLFSGGDRLHGVDGLFSVVQCDRCGLIWLTQPPACPAAYYPEASYASHGGPDSGRHFSMGWRRVGLLRRSQAVWAVKQSGSVLDVGCGDGDFLHALGARGEWNLLGVDVSRTAATRAQEKYGITVLTGQLSDLQLPAGGFDVVTMWHVLEHLPAPRRVLGEVHRLLNEEGVLIVSCPMADSAERRLFGRYWAGYDVPRHLFTFSRRTLPALLEESGFTTRELPRVALGLNSFRISVGFWLTGLFPSLAYTSKSLSGGASAMALALLPVVELLRHLTEWGSSVGTFLAVKRRDLGRDGGNGGDG